MKNIITIIIVLNIASFAFGSLQNDFDDEIFDHSLPNSEERLLKLLGKFPNNQETNIIQIDKRFNKNSRASLKLSDSDSDDENNCCSFDFFYKTLTVLCNPTKKTNRK
jgi:hypothetical protein